MGPGLSERLAARIRVAALLLLALPALAQTGTTPAAPSAPQAEKPAAAPGGGLTVEFLVAPPGGEFQSYVKGALKRAG